MSEKILYPKQQTTWKLPNGYTYVPAVVTKKTSQKNNNNNKNSAAAAGFCKFQNLQSWVFRAESPCGLLSFACVRDKISLFIFLTCLSSIRTRSSVLGNLVNWWFVSLIKYKLCVGKALSWHLKLYTSLHSFHSIKSDLQNWKISLDLCL